MCEKKPPLKTGKFTFEIDLSEVDKVVQMVGACVVKLLLPHLSHLIPNTNQLVEEPIRMPALCRLLGISDTTARDWMRKGYLPFHRKGSRVFFFKSEVLKSLEQPLRRGKGRVL